MRPGGGIRLSFRFDPFLPVILFVLVSSQILVGCPHRRANDTRLSEPQPPSPSKIQVQPVPQPPPQPPPVKPPQEVEARPCPVYSTFLLESLSNLYSKAVSDVESLTERESGAGAGDLQRNLGQMVVEARKSQYLFTLTSLSRLIIAVLNALDRGEFIHASGYLVEGKSIADELAKFRELRGHQEVDSLVSGYPSSETLFDQEMPTLFQNYLNSVQQVIGSIVGARQLGRMKILGKPDTVPSGFLDSIVLAISSVSSAVISEQYSEARKRLKVVGEWLDFLQVMDSVLPLIDYLGNVKQAVLTGDLEAAKGEIESGLDHIHSVRTTAFSSPGLFPSNRFLYILAAVESKSLDIVAQISSLNDEKDQEKNRQFAGQLDKVIEDIIKVLTDPATVEGS